MRCIAAFLITTVLAVSAFGQSCERTLTLGVAPPFGLPLSHDAQDYEATLGHERISVVKVQPFKKARTLILLPADYDHITKDKGDFDRLVGWLSGITALPGNASVAYGLYAQKMIFSDHFTSDPQELRSSLEELVKNAKTGSLGANYVTYDRLVEAVGYFGQPQPGDSVILLSNYAGEYTGDYSRPVTRYSDVVARFLQAGIRLFVIIPPFGSISSIYSDTTLNMAQGTGGYVSTVADWHRADKKREAKTFYSEMGLMLNFNGLGYLVTVAVPQDARGGGYWNLTLNAAARSRIGFSPKKKMLFAYPNLLLCGTSKNGDPMIAGVDRQHP
jgi:hypothetical protein